MKKTVSFICILLLIISCKKNIEQPVKEKQQGLVTEKAMVVTARVEASTIGS